MMFTKPVVEVGENCRWAFYFRRKIRAAIVAGRLSICEAKPSARCSYSQQTWNT